MPFRFYMGPSAPTPIMNLVRFKQPELAPYYIVSFGYSRVLGNWKNLFSFEVEGEITKHLESPGLFSFSPTFVVRWLETPWSNVFPGSNFAFGNGLSYATGLPQAELAELTRTSQLLYHFTIELAVYRTDLNSWEAFFRIHHRSGAFGLFNNVAGGSDFMCFGTRYRFQ